MDPTPGPENGKNSKIVLNKMCIIFATCQAPPMSAAWRAAEGLQDGECHTSTKFCRQFDLCMCRTIALRTVTHLLVSTWREAEHRMEIN